MFRKRILFGIPVACLFLLLACDAWYFIDFANESGQDLLFKCYFKQRKALEIDTFAYTLGKSKTIYVARYFRVQGRDSIIEPLDSSQSRKYLSYKKGLKIVKRRRAPVITGWKPDLAAANDSSSWKDTVTYAPLPKGARWTSIASHLGKEPQNANDDYSGDLVHFLCRPYNLYQSDPVKIEVLDKDSGYIFSLFPYNSPAGMHFESEGGSSYKIAFTPEHVKMRVRRN